jgi:MFS transporter, DHA1 family, tetracycline resistance protein
VNQRFSLFLIFLVVFIDLLGFGILIPILPAFATVELGVDEAAIGIAIAIYSLFQFFFNPVFGSLSDKYGRKPVIVFTLLLNSAGYIIFAFTDSYMLLLLSRIVAGIGGSSIGVAQAYIADVTTRENRAKGMGMIGAAFGLGFVFGPLIGGFLSEYGYMVTGLAAAGFSFLAFLSTLLFLPETNRNRGSAGNMTRKIFDFSAVKKLFNNPLQAAVVVLFFTLTFSVANIYGTFALLGVKIYGFTDLQNGYMYTIMGISSAIVQGGLLNLMSKYLTDIKLITLGSFLMMFSLALLPFGGSFLGLAIIVIVLSFGTGALQPVLISLMSKVTPESEQGIILGLNQSFSSFARVLGPLWGGFAFEFIGYPFPFLTGAAFTSLIFLASITFLPRVLKTQGEKISTPF